MNKFLTNHPFINCLMKSKLNIAMMVVSFILFLGIVGYVFILYGGKLIIDDEEIVLDAATTIETADGEVISKLYNENRLPIDIQSVPTHVQHAFIAIEDKRFYHHAGVDFISVVRAIGRDLLAQSKVEGASTITQQLAKNLFLHHDKTWMRKTKEVMVAIYLERNYSKDKILEMYLNTIYFGHGTYGIEAASQKYFSKSVEELSVIEGALLAGIVNSPTQYSPIEQPEQAVSRRNLVLESMDENNFLSTEKRLEEQGKTLGLHINEEKSMPWLDSYLDLVTKEAVEDHQITFDELKRGGYRIVTNMNKVAQQVAYEQFQKDEHFPGNSEDVEGSFTMIEHHTGKIIANLGGRNYQFGDLNRSVIARQPGSTIKPLIVYGPALMKETYTPFSLMPDQPNMIKDYEISNSDSTYETYVSLYSALMHSKNTTAVWLLNQIGIDYAKSFLKKMMIDLPNDQGLSIALGGLSEGISPLKLAASYGTFANNGQYIKPYTIARIYNRNNELIYQATADKINVFTPQVAWYMTKMLEYTVKEGTASAGKYDKALAGKTGTTEHDYVEGKNKDIWFVGYTPEYVTALWMGNDMSDQVHYLTGDSSYPTILTKIILTEIDKQKELGTAFEKPKHINDLADPIVLPEISNIKAEIAFGGFSLLKGKISWSGSHDPRVVYRVYKKESTIDQRIGEVKGETEFVITDSSLLRATEYYIVPYDPLTKMEGKRSETVKLSL